MRASHAIILGAGCAGLLAAKTLSLFFRRVSIVERYKEILSDAYQTHRIPPNIPQAAHIHVLLKEGQNIINEIFPEILESLSYSCPLIDWARDTEWHGPFGQYPQYNSGVKTYLFSRALLDNAMLCAIKAIKNVNIIIGSAHIIHDKSKKKVLGAQITDDKISYKLFGDLVIDARGRASPILKSLVNAGYKISKTKRVMSSISYSSCIFEQTKEALKKQIYIQIRPKIRHYGIVVSPIENNHMFVTLVTLKERPPKTDEEFNKFLTRITITDIRNLFENARPISAIATYANFTNKRMYLGSVKKWPKNLIVIGDATCVLNPVYGQGMTIAASHVKLLANYCGKILKENWEHDFQQEADTISRFPWLMATIEDQRIQDAKMLSLKTKLLQTYIDRILYKSLHNQNLHYAFMRTLHMLDKPYKLFSPSVIKRAFIG